MSNDISLEVINERVGRVLSDLSKLDSKVDCVDDRVYTMDNRFVEWKTNLSTNTENLKTLRDVEIKSIKDRLDILERVVASLGQLVSWFKKLFWLGVSAVILGGGSLLWAMLSNRVQIVYP